MSTTNGMIVKISRREIIDLRMSLRESREIFAIRFDRCAGTVKNWEYGYRTPDRFVIREMKRLQGLVLRECFTSAK